MYLGLAIETQRSEEADAGLVRRGPHEAHPSSGGGARVDLRREDAFAVMGVLGVDVFLQDAAHCVRCDHATSIDRRP